MARSLGTGSAGEWNGPDPEATGGGHGGGGRSWGCHGAPAGPDWRSRRGLRRDWTQRASRGRGGRKAGGSSASQHAHAGDDATEKETACRSGTADGVGRLSGEAAPAGRRGAVVSRRCLKVSVRDAIAHKRRRSATARSRPAQMVERAEPGGGAFDQGLDD